ncbi:histidine kinase [Mycobacterium sp. MS1601]|uniref:sensor histidine kinase n=1 Tax=Mycobacterium sp. MS1601 TaxID=1936029 RepID=UPI00097931E8|nr:ATP-binding protein [Mycobacterium sp. MS1601]AQA03555.1 histidine kinase [Mycobacterium sp. MS1601]
MGDEFDTSEVCHRDDLRSLFLFESLSDSQLETLCRDGKVVHVEPGPLIAEGEPAASLFVLLDGEIVLTKRSGETDIETLRSSQRGSYFGAWSAFLEEEQRYETSARASAPSRMFVIDAAALGRFLRTEFPMACHFLVGSTVGRSNQNRIVGPHDRMVQLGQLTAGLTHELNNPASAAVRATSTLRDRIAGMRRTLAVLTATFDQAAIHALVELQDRVAERVAKSRDLTPLQKSDTEEAIGDWLEDHDVATPWELASCFSEAGLDVDWLDTVEATVADANASVGRVLEWLHYTVETELLMNEITDSAVRVSSLVSQAKQYSQLDRAPFDIVDVHVLLRNTVAMLSHTLTPDIEVVEDFDLTLAPLACWPAELNQVWTNLIDNAVTAMHSNADRGTLTLRTRPQGDSVRVEVRDTGPGVPEELHQRIFDPFFTTKPVGEGTGLGLDLAARIIDKHRGNMWVESQPGDTRFVVMLPMDPAIRA